MTPYIALSPDWSQPSAPLDMAQKSKSSKTKFLQIGNFILYIVLFSPLYFFTAQGGAVEYQMPDYQDSSSTTQIPVRKDKPSKGGKYISKYSNDRHAFHVSRELLIS